MQCQILHHIANRAFKNIFPPKKIPAYMTQALKLGKKHLKKFKLS